MDSRRKPAQAAIAVLAVLSGALCMPVATGRAEAAWPGEDGLVVFVGQETVGEDGSRNTGLLSFTMGEPQTLRQLTTDSGDRNPQISPDGRQIVFEREIEGATSAADGSAIFVMSSDGQGVQQVTQPVDGESDSEPAFDASGELIIFARRSVVKGGNGDLYSIALGGGDLRQLTSGPAIDGSPAASSTGRQIIFERSRYKPDCRCSLEHVFSMRPDGSHLRNLTPGRGREAKSPDFSPDGRRIVYSAGYLQFASVYMMRANGRHPRQIAGRRIERRGSIEPVFSPSGGTLLAVTTDIYGSELARIRFGKRGARVDRLKEVFAGVSPAWGPAPH